MPGKHNLLSNVPTALAEELIENLFAGGDFRVERIVSRGHRTPTDFWYDQTEHEWVLLLSGAAALRFAADARLVELGPGDQLHIPAHCRHRVEWTAAGEDTIWLAIFYRD